MKFFWKFMLYFLIALLILLSVPALMLALMYYHANNEIIYELSQPYEDIDCIEIVNIENDSYINENKLDSVEIISTIKNELLLEFIDDFETLPCHRFVNDPIYYFDDEALLIHYNDGSLEFVDIFGGYYYNATKDNKKYKYYYFDEEQFEDLIDKYITNYNENSEII